jgi:hypothetical protein
MFRPGDIVQHKLTQERLMVIHANDNRNRDDIRSSYLVRLHNYQTATVWEFEVVEYKEPEVRTT